MLLIKVIFFWLFLNVISLGNWEKFCILNVELLFIVKFICIWFCVVNVGLIRVWFLSLVIFIVIILLIVIILVEILSLRVLDVFLENILIRFMFLLVFIFFINNIFFGLGFIKVLIFMLLFMILKEVDIILVML